MKLAFASSGFSLCVKEDSRYRETKIILHRKFTSVEVISRRDIGEDNASLLLLEQNKHKPMYPYAWPWQFIAHHLFAYISMQILFIFNVYYMQVFRLQDS